MDRMLIKNGMIYDGLGNSPFQGNLLIEGDRIAEIGPGITGAVDQVIDAAGKAVTPGFVDIHRHCDIKPFYDTHFGDCMLAQGITSTIVGNCGISMVPCSPDQERAREMREFDEPVLGPPFSGIETYRDYLWELEKRKLPVNFAAMIGTGSVRITVKGFSNAPYTEAEMKAARELIESALEEGAPGVSSGIMYLPECYGTAEEFGRLLKPVGDWGRVAAFHIRGEGDSMVDSVREAIEIGRRAGCAVEISHFKSCGKKNWRKEIYRAIRLIEGARAAGQDVTVDFYPYEGGSTALTTMLPPAFVDGNLKAALDRLGTKAGVDAFRRLAGAEYKDWDNFCITLGWERILISGVTEEHNRELIGLSVAEAAERFGYEDGYALAARLMNEERGKTAIINMSMCQDDIDAVAKLPYSIVISDSIYAQTDTPHPRMYGAFPKIIREYVRERSLLSMEEAVRKMTSMPARRMGLKDRGILQKGMYADINIFDPEKFRDRASFQNPAVPAEGLDFCIVNGKIACRGGKTVREDCGRVIRTRS